MTPTSDGSFGPIKQLLREDVTFNFRGSYGTHIQIKLQKKKK